MMKSKLFILFFSASIFALTSCTKDDPVPEIDQEEVSGVTLFFTEVEAEAHGDHFHYHEIEGAETDSLVFSGTDFLPDPGAHLHLTAGKSYKFHLEIRDFSGRESQQTFVDRADQHFAFLLGAPEGSLDATYADETSAGEKVQVGITGYLNVLKASDSFVFRYVMRHLNPGVKESIDTHQDIFNADFTNFGGANDLDLKFEMHFVAADGGHDH